MNSTDVFIGDKMEEKAHSIFIGDEVERAIEIIEEENDEYYYSELVNAYADGELDVEVDLRGNYLRVKVND